MSTFLIADLSVIFMDELSLNTFDVGVNVAKNNRVVILNFFIADSLIFCVFPASNLRRFNLRQIVLIFVPRKSFFIVFIILQRCKKSFPKYMRCEIVRLLIT